MNSVRQSPGYTKVPKRPLSNRLNSILPAGADRSTVRALELITVGERANAAAQMSSPKLVEVPPRKDDELPGSAQREVSRSAKEFGNSVELRD
jgi:hypothetical protein